MTINLQEIIMIAVPARVIDWNAGLFGRRLTGNKFLSATHGSKIRMQWYAAMKVTTPESVHSASRRTSTFVLILHGNGAEPKEP